MLSSKYENVYKGNYSTVDPPTPHIVKYFIRVLTHNSVGDIHVSTSMYMYVVTSSVQEVQRGMTYDLTIVRVVLCVTNASRLSVCTIKLLYVSRDSKNLLP